MILLLAQTTQPAVEVTSTVATTHPTTPAPAWFEGLQSFFPLILLVGVMYFFLFRSKRKSDKSRTDMLSQLKRGDRVQTIGGILGSVVTADETEVLLKVDESSNTKIRFSRSAIHRVLTDEKTETK